MMFSQNQAGWRGIARSSVARGSKQESVGFFIFGDQAFRERAAVVLGHTIFPLEKIGDVLWLNANLHAPQTREQEIHLVLESGGGTQILDRHVHSLYLAPARSQQTPACGQLLGLYQAPRSKVIALTADSALWPLPEGLGAIGQEIGARHFALDQHGMALALPADGVRHLAADASLFAEHHAAAIAPQPSDRHRNQFRMSHFRKESPGKFVRRMAF